MGTALKQAGLNTVVLLLHDYFHDPASDRTNLQALDSSYSAITSPFYDGSNPATTAEMANLHHAGLKGDVPTFGAHRGYVAASVVACGLQAAGANPTPRSIVANLRKVTAFDANGLQLEPTNFSTQFSALGSFQWGSTCQNWVQLVNGKYRLDTPHPICGHAIPGTNNLP